MAALTHAPREHFDTLPRRVYRESSHPQETTLAMHWDGTYRDRRNPQAPYATRTGFISDDAWPRDPAIDLAKHLESREETDHRLGYLSDNERELLSDLQHQQF